MASRTRWWATLIMLGALCTPLPAGKFRNLVAREGEAFEEAVLKVPRPPDMLVPFRTASLKVESSVANFPYANQLQLSIEKELTGALTVVSSGAEGSLHVAVLEFAPPTDRTYTVKENRVVNGQIISFPPQKIDVQYWEAQASLTLKTSLKDAAGMTLDESIIGKPFYMKRALDRASLPQRETILTAVLLQAAHDVRQRYALGSDAVRIKLAVDKELGSGNQQAKEGNWAAALSLWQAAQLKDNSADRKFNMALATYALGFEAYLNSQNAELAMPKLTEAARLMDEARREDPKEKYIAEGSGRLVAATLEMDKAVQQGKAIAIQRDRLADRKSDELAAKTSGRKDLSGPRQDTPQEAEFRNYIREQWKNRAQAPADADYAQLQSTGRLGWKLSASESERVVREETSAWKERQEKAELYLTNLKGFLRGNVLSAEGRTQLKKLSSNLGLTDVEVAAIESRVSFQEEGKTPVPPVRRQPVPPRPKPASVKQPGPGVP